MRRERTFKLQSTLLNRIGAGRRVSQVYTLFPLFLSGRRVF